MLSNSPINWLHTSLLGGSSLIAIYTLFFVKLSYPTFIFSVLYYFFTGLGITAGYHRYWAHRSFDASLPLQLFLLLGGSGAFEGSVRWWCRDHRAHHRYTDTDKDPYSAHKGLFWSHIGWMLVKQDPKTIGKADISDLNRDPILRWQHRNYVWVAAFMAFVLPSLIAGFGWGDFRGGFFWAGVVRLCFVHHATFCVNSLAHWLGESTFDDRLTPKDHIITAFVTLGEGYHNFHHEFPNDYRNAIKFYQYDPTKWFILANAFFGLAFNLKQFTQNEINKGKYHMKLKELERAKEKILWPKPMEKLGLISKKEFEEKAVDNGWVLMNGIAYDVNEFMDEHPGGRSLIKTRLGTDIGEAFNGGVYRHSNAAKNLLDMMSYGRVVE